MALHLEGRLAGGNVFFNPRLDFRGIRPDQVSLMVTSLSSGRVDFWSEICYTNYFIKLLKILKKERQTMARACEICHKGPIFGHSISHSHKASKKKWGVNLQRVKAKTENGVRKIWVCTRCLRSGRVQKAV